MHMAKEESCGTADNLPQTSATSPLHVLSPSAFQFLICFFKKNYFLVGALAHDPPELARLELLSLKS